MYPKSAKKDESDAEQESRVVSIVRRNGYTVTPHQEQGGCHEPNRREEQTVIEQGT